MNGSMDYDSAFFDVRCKKEDFFFQTEKNQVKMMKHWDNPGTGLLQGRSEGDNRTDTSYVFQLCFFSNSKLKVSYKNSVHIK